MTRRALAVGPATLRWALLGAPLGLAAALTVEAPLLFLAVAVLSFGWFAALILTTLLSRNGPRAARSTDGHDRHSPRVASPAR